MSELINNRAYRKQVLKDIILALHEGKPVHEVKAKFDEMVKDLSPTELSAIEQELINEGLPVAEVQRLCDVHVAVFKDALVKERDIKVPSGHPLHIFIAENRALERFINEELKPALAELTQATGEDEKAAALKLAEKLNLLEDVDKHYSRKENLLFPYLEKYGISGPSKVMWGADDEIRALLKEARDLAVRWQPGQKETLRAKTEEVIGKITEMVFKEEKVLFPTSLDTLTEDEWYHILQDSDEIGYCLIEPQQGWRPFQQDPGQGLAKIADEGTIRGYIKFDTGVLTPHEIDLIFRHLPVDITFVDKHDTVKYFSPTKGRIFARTRTIIGRKVENCHPPASVQVVEKLVSDFKNGKKDSEDFWLRLGDKYVLIRYFAVRDENGDYAGTLEVTQDIGPVQNIRGEKRIMD